MKKQQQHLKLILSGILCFLLFNFPFLGMYSGSSRLFGVPALFAGMFIFWALFVLLLFLISRDHPKRNAK